MAARTRSSCLLQREAAQEEELDMRRPKTKSARRDQATKYPSAATTGTGAGTCASSMNQASPTLFPRADELELRRQRLLSNDPPTATAPWSPGRLPSRVPITKN